MRGGVDEVGEGDERGGEADGGAVERRDQDLGVCVEGVGDVQVVGDEGLEPVAAGGFVGGHGARDGDVGAAVDGGSVIVSATERFRGVRSAVVDSRGEVSAFACQDGDVDVVARSYLMHQRGQSIVQVLGHGIELLLIVERDDGYFAPGFEGNEFLWGRHVEMFLYRPARVCSVQQSYVERMTGYLEGSKHRCEEELI